MAEGQTHDLGDAHRSDGGAFHHIPVLVEIHIGVQMPHIARQSLLIHADLDGVRGQYAHVHHIHKGNPLYPLVLIFPRQIERIVPQKAFHDDSLDLILGIVKIPLHIDRVNRICRFDIHRPAQSRSKRKQRDQYAYSYSFASKHLSPALLTL